MIISTLSTDSEITNQIWEVRVSWPGWFDMELANNNIVADKGLNPFDGFAAECVHLCPQGEECTSSSWGDSKM